MKIERFAMRKKTAYKLWKEYTQACNDNPKDKFLKDMKAVYNQLKGGRKVIDIYEIFRRSGFNSKYEPKLAIARADCKEVFLRERNDGDFSVVKFLKNGESWHIASPDDIVISADLQLFPKIPDGFRDKGWNGNEVNELTRKATVPAVPASVRPKNLSKYYILWEVKKWSPMPPKDPYLLRRLTRNMFVVVAGWELTKLEQAVMKGRVY